MCSWRHRDASYCGVPALCRESAACSSTEMRCSLKVLSGAYADNDESIRFEVRVSRVLRGGVKPKADVYTGNDSGRLNWDVDREHVVLASRRESRLWSGDDCGPLSDPTKVAEAGQCGQFQFVPR